MTGCLSESYPQGRGSWEEDRAVGGEEEAVFHFGWGWGRGGGLVLCGVTVTLLLPVLWQNYEVALFWLLYRGLRPFTSNGRMTGSAMSARPASECQGLPFPPSQWSSEKRPLTLQ